MDKANPLSAPMTGRNRTLDDPYTPCKEEEEEFHSKTQYLAGVGALLYLSTHTRPDISFIVGVLTRHSQKPSVRHWNGVKHLLCYLRGTEDLGDYSTLKVAKKRSLAIRTPVLDWTKYQANPRLGTFLSKTTLRSRGNQLSKPS